MAKVGNGTVRSLLDWLRNFEKVLMYRGCWHYPSNSGEFVICQLTGVAILVLLLNRQLVFLFNVPFERERCNRARRTRDSESNIM